ncbi:MAG: lytic transglycosylase [Rhodobacteraceae bacterium]|nr:lytic transglycosylase [Paracoccaceae bacterium]|tara:strand:+ start:1646 stop:2887 length:1242 start_codon:yes stop_codon:yes gene_type:complete
MKYFKIRKYLLKKIIYQRKIKLLLAFLIAFQGSHALGSTLVNCGGDYKIFLKDIGSKAIQRGVDKNAVSLALKYSKQSKKVLEMDRRQSTFRLSFLDFTKSAINSYRLKNGIKNMEKYLNIFNSAEAMYGVPAEVITAFWGMETDFGAVQGNFSTLSALATLGHDCRRPEIFQEEYIAAIKLFADDLIEKEITGAWAGEIGQVQMLPSDILIYGTDGDGDGLVNLKKSSPDAILTAAVLISSMGWRPNEPWIEEVIVTDGFPWEKAGFGRELTLGDWKNLGVKSRIGKFAVANETKATLLLPQGSKGPKFLAYPNFDVYLRWNDSFIYTVTAAHLATRLAGAPKFVSNDPENILTLREMVELQKILKSRGLNVGKVDGILGRNTRQSVRQVQMEFGFLADSWPTKSLLKKLKK